MSTTLEMAKKRRKGMVGEDVRRCQIESMDLVCMSNLVKERELVLWGEIGEASPEEAEKMPSSQ